MWSFCLLKFFTTGTVASSCQVVSNNWTWSLVFMMISLFPEITCVLSKSVLCQSKVCSKQALRVKSRHCRQFTWDVRPGLSLACNVLELGLPEQFLLPLSLLWDETAQPGGLTRPWHCLRLADHLILSTHHTITSSLPPFNLLVFASPCLNTFLVLPTFPPDQPTYLLTYLPIVPAAYHLSLTYYTPPPPM